MRHAYLIVMVLAVVVVFAPAAAGPQDIIDGAFGLQKDGATLAQVRRALEPHADEDAVRFAMGTVDFLLAGEFLVQRAHRHGFLMTFRDVAPMMGERAGFLQWLGNDNAQETTLADVRDAIDGWSERLSKADRTLTGVDGDFICVITPEEIRFDVNGDGRTTSAESLHAFFALLPSRWVWNPERQRREMQPMVPEDMEVAFDRGDASWMQGYCHLLMGVADWMLAHDWSETFDHTGHVFFPRAKIKFDYLPGSTWSLEKMMGGMRTPAPFDLTDVIAFFGNMRLPVSDAERMGGSLEHFRQCVTHGRTMWKHYDRERDDDREWIPNPNQTAAFNEVAVDEDARDAWLLFLDEVDAILHGRKVMRFWRGDGTRGIDVPKVFNEPREFDLVYWLQGSAAAPYLREGEMTTPGTWAQLRRVFDRRVFRYSFWFN